MRRKRTILGLFRDPTFRSFSGIVREHKRVYVGTIAVQLVSTLLALVFAETGRRLFDLAPNVPRGSLTVILIVFAVTAVLRMLFRFWDEWLRSLLNETVVYAMRRKILYHLLHLPLGFHESSHTSNAMNIMNNELEMTKNFFVGDIPRLISLPVSFAMIGSYLLVVHPLLGLIALSIGPLQLISNVVLRKKYEEASRLQNQVTRDVFFQMGESLQGIREVKANQVEQNIDDRMKEIQWQGVAYNVFLTKVASIRGVCRELPGQVGYILGLGTGALLMTAGEVGPGGLIAFITLLDRVATPFTTVVEIISNLQRTIAGAERLLDTMEMPRETVEAGRALPRSAPTIQFENVGFHYVPEVPVLKSVSFGIPKGTSVALVGPSGSGKSTIIKLLFRLYDPQSGRIDIGGHPITEYATESLRAGMALVSQDIYLFDSTVAENITMGRKQVTVEEMRRAADLAQASTFINELPEGFDTRVGERGIKLSQGQKQRISIARAIVRNASVVVLDEPTSALDVETEYALQHTLDEWAYECTRIIIAHRLSTIKQADTIVFVESGKIAEVGPPSQLLESGGRFRGYWERQANLQFTA